MSFKTTAICTNIEMELRKISPFIELLGKEFERNRHGNNFVFTTFTNSVHALYTCGCARQYHQCPVITAPC